MPLITDSAGKVFDTTKVHKRDLIRAQHSTWDQPRNGIITAVSEDKLTVLFMPGIGNVTSYYTIGAAEVHTGNWIVRWTTDLETIDTEGVVL